MSSVWISSRLELIGFAWFVVFIPFLPIYLTAEIGGLVAVLVKPSLSNSLGSLKAHLYSIAAAAITYIAWKTNQLMIW
jgi:hypothetical protein